MLSQRLLLNLAVRPGIGGSIGLMAPKDIVHFPIDPTMGRVKWDSFFMDDGLGVGEDPFRLPCSRGLLLHLRRARTNFSTSLLSNFPHVLWCEQYYYLFAC